MNKWFLSAELFSLIIILILMLNFYERRWRGFPQRKTYQLCLLTSGGSILLNILCVYTIYYAWELPLWVNLLCNSLYFLLIVAVSTIVAYYLLRLLFHHIYQQRQQRASPCLASPCCAPPRNILTERLPNALKRA